MSRQLLLALACALVWAGPAAAADYDDWTDGNWVADTTDTWGAGIDVYPGAGDTATIESNTVTVTANVPATLTSLTLDGGTLNGQNNRRFLAPIAVNSQSTVNVASGVFYFDNRGHTVTLTGSGQIVKTGAGRLYLDEPLSVAGFSGGWDIQDGQLFVLSRNTANPGGLGTGTVYVRNTGELWLNALAGSPTPPDDIVVDTGGLVYCDNTGLPSDSWHVTLNGGTFDIHGRSVYGEFELAADSKLKNSLHWSSDGDWRAELTGGSGFTLTVELNPERYLLWRDGSPDFEGNMDFTGGGVRVYNSSAFGSNATGGTLTFKSGSTHQQDANLNRDITYEADARAGARSAATPAAGPRAASPRWPGTSRSRQTAAGT